jgi:hypothetical protein
MIFKDVMNNDAAIFKDTLKKEENLKKELSMRLAIAEFMQETLHSMANKKKSNASEGAGAEEVCACVYDSHLCMYCTFCNAFKNTYMV